MDCGRTFQIDPSVSISLNCKFEESVRDNASSAIIGVNDDFCVVDNQTILFSASGYLQIRDLRHKIFRLRFL